MERRSFLAALGGAGVSFSATPAMKTRYYAVETYELVNGTQAARLNEYFSKHRIPAMRKIHSGPMLVLEAVVAPHMPQLAFFTGYESLEQMSQVSGKINTDTDLNQQFAAVEKGPEPAFQSLSSMIVQATPYSPELTSDERKAPRFFEWRFYHSPTFDQLRQLHERFAGPEIKIFHRTGIHPVLYASTMIGPDLPNLTYLIPFDSLDAREKAWAAFGADPEWQKVRQASIDKGGQISQRMRISLWRATPYSPAT